MSDLRLAGVTSSAQVKEKKLYKKNIISTTACYYNDSAFPELSSSIIYTAQYTLLYYDA